MGMPMIPRPIQPTFSGKVAILLGYDVKDLVDSFEKCVRVIHSNVMILRTVTGP